MLVPHETTKILTKESESTGIVPENFTESAMFALRVFDKVIVFPLIFVTFVPEGIAKGFELITCSAVCPGKIMGKSL